VILLYLFVGLILISGSVIWFIYQYKLLSNKEFAVGTVDIIADPRSNSKRCCAYVVNYFTKQGFSSYYQSGYMSKELLPYKKGEKIRVFYDPRRRMDSGVAMFGSHFVFPLLLASLGLFLMGIPIGNYIMDVLIH
jgi:hypothetical protein